jgi:hypothetical protein
MGGEPVYGFYGHGKQCLLSIVQHSHSMSYCTAKAEPSNLLSKSTGAVEACGWQLSI